MKFYLERQFFNISYFPPLLCPSLYFLLLLPLALSLTLILNPPLTQVHTKPLLSVYKYHYSFSNLTIVFHYFYFKKPIFTFKLKEILKAGCCFLVSCTTACSTHGYMMSMFIQFKLICITYMSAYMYMYIIIMYIMLSENVFLIDWLIMFRTI